MGDLIEFPIEQRGTIPGTVAQWIALLRRVQRKLEELGPGHVKITVRIEHTSKGEKHGE